MRAHSLRTLFGHFGVLAFQPVKYLGGGFRFAAAATPFDFATQTDDYRLATLLIFFQKSQPIPNDLASGGVAPTLHLPVLGRFDHIRKRSKMFTCTLAQPIAAPGHTPSGE